MGVWKGSANGDLRYGLWKRRGGAMEVWLGLRALN